MNAQLKAASALVIGTPLEGGHYAGRIKIAGVEYGLVVAPKKEGDLKESIWIAKYKDVPGALSLADGATNTAAMADAGSKLAQKIVALKIGGHTDWYLPALDELEICYRAFKPTEDENSKYSRSGINVSALPPTYPYSSSIPGQTMDEPFRAGGAEAFQSAWYWSSSQRAAGSGFAWGQGFSGGDQFILFKVNDCRARAVRRFSL